jgi:hypothetical protein
MVEMLMFLVYSLVGQIRGSDPLISLYMRMFVK